MELPRRSILKATGTSLATGAVLGGIATGAAADPADEWDPAHYSNYRNANRGVGDVNWIVIHTTAGSYAGAKSWFKNPNANVSAHYVVSNDGYATKMVRFDDVAYHAGGFNANSIGIEHEWYDGMGPVTRDCYRKSAEIVDYLADRFGIEKRLVGPDGPCRYDSGIIRHTHAPTDAYCERSNATSCPQGFNFDTYMSILDGGDGGGDAPDPAFEVGDRVETTADLNVRTGPGTGYPAEHTAPEGSAGYVRDGPRTAGGYVWWKVGYNAGFEGWSVQAYLTAAPPDGGSGGRVTRENVDALASVLTSEAGRFLAKDVERRAVGYTVVNRMDDRGTDRVKDVWDAYAHGKEGSEESRELARAILSGEAADPTQGATFFYSPRSMPAAGEDTGGNDTSGGLEWVPGLDRRHYRPSWGRDNERVLIDGVRPRFYKFYTAAAADPGPDCADGICVGDDVFAAAGGVDALDKPRSFGATVEPVPGESSGTVVGDWIYATDGEYAKVRWEGGPTGYVPVADLSTGDEAPDPAFEVGDRVETVTDLNVRRGPGLEEDVEWTAPAGSAGYVRDGPVRSDGYLWWKVGYNAGTEGWSVQEYLAAAPLQNDAGGSGHRTETGSLSTGESAFFTHDPAAGTDELTVRVTGPADADFDLYVTVDGRPPSREDHDDRSWSMGSDERVALRGRELSDRLGVLVQAYDGSGEFTLEFVPGSSGDDGTDDGDGRGGDDSGGDGEDDDGGGGDGGADDGEDGDGDDGGGGDGDDGGFWDIIDDIFEGWS